MKKDFDFSGVWHGKYNYRSTSRSSELTSEYDAKIYQAGNQIVIQSLPSKDGSYVLVRLTLDGKILTGTWHEQTSPTGHYKGVIYYGALQFIMSEDSQSMKGKWVGFNREMNIQSGDWEFHRAAGKT